MHYYDDDDQDSRHLLSSPPPPALSRGPLHAGAQWAGEQKSGRCSYKVTVRIETVDLVQGTVAGVIRILNLTPDLEKLSTYFEGEIIGDQFGFLTGKWGAGAMDDQSHWGRFGGSYRKLKSQLTGPKLNYNNTNKPFLFMRWKEKFVVPDHHVENVHGASFAGFYYLCLEFNPPVIPTCEPISVATTPTSHSLSPTRSFGLYSHRDSNPSASDTSRMSSVVMRSRSSIASRHEPERTQSSALVLEDESISSYPITLVSSPRPRQPRRLSSTAFSYAAAVTTSPPLTTIPLPPPPPDDSDVTSAKESETTSHHPNFASPRVPFVPIIIPIPQGASIEDFPPPSSPPLTRSLGSGGWGRRRSERSGVSSPQTVEQEGERGRAGRVGEATMDLKLGDRGKGREKKKERVKDDFGMGSWSRATITGFYYFQNSEPYQELSLNYVPSNRGGSQAFEFR